MKLPSKYQIGDTISNEEYVDAEIIAIRFTIGKVYYDILDKFEGKIYYNIDSSIIN